MARKVAIIKTDSLPPGESRVVELMGRELAVFNVDGQFFVLENACPHAGGPLSEGTLEGQTVTCPWHAWHFDVKSGKCENMPLDANSVACELDGEWVKVELPA